MLPSFLTSNPVTTSSGLESPESQVFSGQAEQSNSPLQGFSSIFEKLGGRLLSSEDQKGFTASFILRPEKIGESLPPFAEPTPESATLLSPETLTGEALMAYLMANSGEKAAKPLPLTAAKSGLDQLPISLLTESIQELSAEADQVHSIDNEVTPLTLATEPFDESLPQTLLVNIQVEDESAFELTESIEPFEEGEAELLAENDDLVPNAAGVYVGEDNEPLDLVDSASDEEADQYITKPLDNNLVNEDDEAVNNLLDETTEPVEDDAPELIAAPFVAGVTRSEQDAEVSKKNKNALGQNADPLLTSKPMSIAGEPDADLMPSSNKTLVESTVQALTEETTFELKGTGFATADSKSESGLTMPTEAMLKRNQESGRLSDSTNLKELDIETLEPENVEQMQSLHRTATKVTQEVNITPAMESAEKAIKLTLAANALAERIQTMVKGDLKHAFIRLDPPELGALEIRVQVHHDQTHIQIVSPSGQVREALESQSVRLREALAEQGLNMANLDVSDQHSRQDSRQNGEERGSRTGDAELGDGLPDASAKIQTNIGLVDQYV